MATKLEILPEDILGGLDAVISTFVHNPAFHSQAKTKLTNNAVGDAIYSALVKELNKFISGLDDNQIKSIKTKIVNNAKIRTAAEVAKATKKKSVAVRNPANLPSNLSDCKYAGVDVENSELYICLHGDTKIRLLDGTVKKISDIEQEYKNKELMVCSVNSDGDFIPAKARDVRITSYKSDLIKINLSDGSSVECTKEHRFMSKDTMDWVEAKDIKAGDCLYRLVFSEGSEPCKDLDYKVLSTENIRYDEPIPVYCLTVENEFHSYCLESGLVTHNCEGLSACFIASTPVMLSDGYTDTMEHLAGEEFYVKSFDGESFIDVKATAFKTRKANKLIKITMEDGTSFTCTPDHKIFCDGEWVEAKDLSVGSDVKNFFD